MFILRSNDGMAQYQICKIDTYVVYFDDALAVFHKSSRQIIFHVIFLKKKDFFAITVRHHICILVLRILWLLCSMLNWGHGDESSNNIFDNYLSWYIPKSDFCRKTFLCKWIPNGKLILIFCQICCDFFNNTFKYVVFWFQT